MTEPSSQVAIVLSLAFLVGAAFGAICQKTRFCTMGAIADLVLMGGWTRLRMWFLAAGVAILGTIGAEAAGWLALDKSLYRSADLLWLSHLAGGLSFGAGMVLASGCGARTLVRLGAGSIKALVVLLVTGTVALMTMRGALAPLRAGLLDPVSLHWAVGQGFPAWLQLAGLPRLPALILAAALTGGGLCLLALRRGAWREPGLLSGGAGVGLCVVAAWLVSGCIGYLPEHPETLQEAFLATSSGRPESLSFVGPQGYGLELLLYWSDSSRHPTFGILLALGTVAGAAVRAVAAGEFRWEGFADTADTIRHLAGGSLMGFGGVTALGCSIGQGISGLSTLACGAFLTVAAIVAGAWMALAVQLRQQ